jgi:hypothetical protein
MLMTFSDSRSSFSSDSNRPGYICHRFGVFVANSSTRLFTNGQAQLDEWLQCTTKWRLKPTNRSSLISDSISSIDTNMVPSPSHLADICQSFTATKAQLEHRHQVLSYASARERPHEYVHCLPSLIAFFFFTQPSKPSDLHARVSTTADNATLDVKQIWIHTLRISGVQEVNWFA